MIDENRKLRRIKLSFVIFVTIMLPNGEIRESNVVLYLS